MKTGDDTGFRVGTDIGGTFTDIMVLAPDGSYWTRKVLSTPDDYARGIIAGLGSLVSEIGLSARELGEVVHGTTVATNAILELKGAKTALLTTAGFRDVLELRRLRTPQLYDRFYEPPRPIVERRLRLEVVERLDAAGEVICPLDERSVERALDRILADEATAVAVCLLHSYRNPAHERRVGELVRRRLPNVFLSLSVDVLPEIREYERTSTTVINAYVGPVVRSYVNSLGQQLRELGVTAPLLIMQSNGGIMSAEAAALAPVQIVESGPAAGVIAAHETGQRAGARNLISFDMGGTTAKASMIEDGEIGRTTEYEVGAGISLSSRLVKGGGHALKVPVLDISEVGAGGGSIVWIDRGGALKVGPRSAGAVPGPVCYGRGGQEPTVTDANVVLGYINPRGLAGGTVPIDLDRAAASLAPRAAELGMALDEFAYGVFTIANATMIRAIKAVSTYRGRDPRDFALLAFGGSGPIHAAGIARELGMRRVIVPPAPGLFSAVGLLAARRERHIVQTFFSAAAEIDLSALNAVYAGVETRARTAMAADRADGDIVCRRTADLRYVGQGYELTVPAPAGSLTPSSLATLVEVFEQEHERTYGHRAEREPVELVNLRVSAHVVGDRPRAAKLAGHDHASIVSSRRSYFGPEAGFMTTPVIDRSALTPDPRPGPLIIEEYDTTTIVPPDRVAWRDASDNIMLDPA